MKLDMPDTSRMTQAQRIDALQQAIIQTHGCLESHRDETRASFGDVNRQIGEMRAAVDVGNGYSAALLKRLNVEPGAQTVKPAVGAWPLWKMIATGLGCLSGAVLAFQIAAPVVTAAAVALYRALMGAAT